MKMIAKLGQEFGQYVIQLTAELMGAGEPKSLSEMERHIRELLLKLGRFLLGAWLRLLVEPYPAESVPCGCGGEAAYQFNRVGTLLTILGQLEYKRPYYLCASCQKGIYPLDQKLGLRPGQMSAELESLSGMTGAQLSFGQGSQLFEALTLISLSDHSLAKATQAMGHEVQAQEADWIGQSRDEAWLQEQDRLAERPKRLYGSLDAAKVHIRGAEADPWRDLKVGAWFTTTANPPQKPDEDWQIAAADITYYCDILEASEFGHLLWATGCQRQAHLAQELIFWAMGRNGFGTRSPNIIPKRSRLSIGFTPPNISPP